MPKLIKDILSEYEAELKEKKTPESTLPGAKIINAVVGVVKRPDFYQTVFGGVADAGSVGTAITGASAQVKQLGAGGDQVQRDVADGTAGFLGGVGDLVGGVAGFLKGAKDASAANMGAATQIAGVADGLGVKGEGLSDTLQDTGGPFKKAALMARQVARAAFAVADEAIRYRRLNRTKLNFNFWLKVELSKRRLMHEDMAFLSLLEKDKLGSDAHKKIFAEIDDKAFSLDEIKRNLVGDGGSEQLDSLKKFRKRMNDAMVRLMELNMKARGALTPDDQDYLAKNKDLLDFIKDKTPGAVPSALDEAKIKCLQLRLEQGHAVRLLARMDERIEKRIIHRVATKGDDPEVVRKLEKRLTLNEKLETFAKDLIPKKFSSFIKTDFKELKEKVKTPDLISQKEKEEASEFDKKYEKQHEEKIKSGKKTITAKALLVASYAAGLAAVIVGLALISNPATAIPVIAAIAIVGLALHFAAKKVKPDVVVRVNKNINDFYGKIKQHLL